MSSRVLISDAARHLLEREQERRIQAKWKRGYSLEQIASEAFFWFISNSPYLDSSKDDNAVIKEGL
jgi:hypothetical protein